MDPCTYTQSLSISEALKNMARVYNCTALDTKIESKSHLSTVAEEETEWSRRQGRRIVRVKTFFDPRRSWVCFGTWKRERSTFRTKTETAFNAAPRPVCKAHSTLPRMNMALFHSCVRHDCGYIPFGVMGSYFEWPSSLPPFPRLREQARSAILQTF